MDFETIDRWHQDGLREGRQGVMGALVVRPDGRIFAQRRSPHRRTFPNCWDLIGGHIEPGETPWEALAREITEETGWTLDRVLELRKMVDWEAPGRDGVPELKREFVLTVTVKGDWDHPRLEADKASEGRWFGADDLALLNENRQGGDTYVFDLFRAEFE